MTEMFHENLKIAVLSSFSVQRDAKRYQNGIISTNNKHLMSAFIFSLFDRKYKNIISIMFNNVCKNVT